MKYAYNDIDLTNEQRDYIPIEHGNKYIHVDSFKFRLENKRHIIPCKVKFLYLVKLEKIIQPSGAAFWFEYHFKDAYDVSSICKTAKKTFETFDTLSTFLLECEWTSNTKNRIRVANVIYDVSKKRLIKYPRWLQQ